jgi:bifunctional aspartokinase / homoserine dehydrogenase 1
MAMTILKFGGSSIATPDRIRNVVDIVERAFARNRGRIAVVFSAFGGVTDQLLGMSALAAEHREQYRESFTDLKKRHTEAVKRLIGPKRRKIALAAVLEMLEELRETVHGVYLVKECSLKTRDFILSFGERLSSTIIAEAMKERGMNAEFCDSRPLVKTDAQFGSARVDIEATYRNIRGRFANRKPQAARKRTVLPKPGAPKVPRQQVEGPLQVITGFIGTTRDDETTTLGRGGSDYTASLFGAALGADEIEIWTDVDGVMTADPRKVEKAFPVASLSYEEAMELSHFGAKVIYPPSIQPGMEKNIPLRILNSFRPEFEGTVIGRKSPSPFLVRGISSIDDIALLLVEGGGMFGVVGFAHRLFGALARNRINLILISQASSEHSICLAVDPHAAKTAKKVIEEEFALELHAKKLDPVVIELHASIIAVVGENMRRQPGISARLFQALGKNGVNVLAIAQGSSELNISVVVPKADLAKSLNALHDAFFLSGAKTVNLFVLGTGLIGGTLLGQMSAHRETLLKAHALDLRIVGLGNVDKMAFDKNGIKIPSWKERLGSSAEKISLPEFAERMRRMNLPNSIFVDCTGSSKVVDLYEGILNGNISIVTPNKIANSGPYARYRRLRETAFRRGVKFLYETNVGAGLPVINTLNDLVASGDVILKIEAVLSGTLSFIFNSFKGDKTFSRVVAEARSKGLSEPDPREDLSGRDFARKLLILGREIGLPLEPEDIKVERILPEKCRKAPSIDAFFRELEKCDGAFEARRKSAAAKGRALRFIGSLENGRAGVSLVEVAADHPFYHLSGSDNMIVFTTERYRERPLVIKGPGAGAEVTAAGVFADVIRIANFLS